MKKILVLHGVNLNMFGQRDPKQYGTITLDQINQQIHSLADELGLQAESYQTNHEGDLVEKIHQAYQNKTDAIVINAGAWTHYSYAIRDALDILEIPIIEVHMSNIHSREDFRKHSVFSDIATAQISGLGLNSYLLAIRAVNDLIQ